MNKKNISKLGFTFVELIVVITIISILGIIGIITYNGYIGGSRDTSRLSQVSSIYNALETYRINKFLPIPSNKINIYANSVLISYQGYLGEEILEKIGYHDIGKDPKDDVYFTYYLTSDLRRAQILTFMEEEIKVSFNIIDKVKAVNYSKRIPKVYGNKLGIITESGTNNPIQEIPSLFQNGLDIITTNSYYNAYISNDFTVTGTGEVLSFLKDGAGRNCKEIIDKDSGKKGLDGIYYINPEGIKSYKVYCDMTSDGGGWTLVAFNKQDTNTVPVYQDFMTMEVNVDSLYNKDQLNLMASLNPEKFSNTQNTKDAMFVTLSYPGITILVDKDMGNWTYDTKKCDGNLQHTSRTEGCVSQPDNNQYTSKDKFNIAFSSGSIGILPYKNDNFCDAGDGTCKFEFYLR